MDASDDLRRACVDDGRERSRFGKRLTILTDVCTEIKGCRICGSSDLREVIDLGHQYIASIFTNEPIPAEVNRPFPLALVRCGGRENCGLVQLRHLIRPDVLYGHYGYRSGTNEMMRTNLRDITAKIEEMVDLAAGDLVADIGCNDGTLLSSYSRDDIERVGVDPSDAVDDIKDPRIRVLNDFFSAEVFENDLPGRKARAVTSIAMFYDLEDPDVFVADVAQVLASDGVWVVELSYLPFMLRANSFDTICHEHQEYYALRQLEWLMSEHDLRVHKAELNDVNGGSIRLFIRPSAAGPPPDAGADELAELRRQEALLDLDTDIPYESFRARVLNLRRDLMELLSDLIGQGRTIYVYGASTKGNVLLQFCGIDKWIVPKAADRNPDKWGTRTLGTEVLIVSEDQVRTDKPDYLLVLPWHFLASFVEREKDFLERGGRFIVPLPTLRVIGKDDRT